MTAATTTFPKRYLPTGLTRKDRAKQARMLLRSRRDYTRRRPKYSLREKLASFRSRTSKHVARARKIYGVDRVVPGAELARKTGCSVAALQEIVRKGEGAFYSSGSRPNQTAQSWGLARLASAITAGNASVVDRGILEAGCSALGTARQLMAAAAAERK